MTSLPPEIWNEILLKTTDLETSQKLFQSFPNSLQLLSIKPFLNHIDKFKYLFAIIQNKIVNVYKEDILIKQLTYDDELENIKFRPNSNHLIISTKNGKIIFWDYVNNLLEYSKNTLLNDNVKTFFDVSPCGNYLVICKINDFFPIYILKFPDIDNLIFIRNVRNILDIYNIYGLYGYPKIKFNPIKKEIAFNSIWHSNWGTTYFKSAIYDFDKMEHIFETDKKIIKIKYDNFGNLFCYIKKEGIFQINNLSLSLILPIKSFIFDFIIQNNIIYYSIHHNNTCEILSFNLLTNINKSIYQGNEMYDLIISKDCQKLLFKTNDNINIYNLNNCYMDRVLDARGNCDFTRF